MNRTNIEWTDYTWNPIKGICPVGCWYCYARKMYKRFGWMDKLEGDKFPIYEDTIFTTDKELEAPYHLKKPSKIFVCSTFELFHPKAKIYRPEIFAVIEKNPQHAFQILTKFPQNIDRPMPDNVWLGVTATGESNGFDDYWKIAGFLKHKPKIAFVCFEPLLGSFNNWTLSLIQHFQWIIVGRLTQFGNRRNPNRRWLEEIVEICKGFSVPIFLKDNLKEIWREPLIQELPK